MTMVKYSAHLAEHVSIMLGGSTNLLPFPLLALNVMMAPPSESDTYLQKREMIISIKKIREFGGSSINCYT